VGRIQFSPTLSHDADHVIGADLPRFDVNAKRHGVIAGAGPGYVEAISAVALKVAASHSETRPRDNVDAAAGVVSDLTVLLEGGEGTGAVHGQPRREVPPLERELTLTNDGVRERGRGVVDPDGIVRLRPLPHLFDDGAGERDRSVGVGAPITGDADIHPL